jgi:GDPmannose 4,6-dehydratase
MKALITGVQGQDGFYLSEFLLDKGYEVVGTRRSVEDPRLNPPGVRVVYGDVSDAFGMLELIEQERPDEIYNLAAITHVADSFSAQAVASAVNYNGACNVIAAGARVGAKVYQASTSELFGSSLPPQCESTVMRPRSPYAVAKLGAYWATVNARDRGLYACQGILFNHESPRRTPGFVTQKVAMAVADIRKGKADHITLGNLDACRDWGHAADYVRAMWMIMQQEVPDDYVVATGVMRSVRELCEVAFSCAGLDYREHVRTSDEFKRPLEVEKLCGDPSKVKSIGWLPQVSFQEMIEEMVDAAFER